MKEGNNMKIHKISKVNTFFASIMMIMILLLGEGIPVFAAEKY